MIINQHVAAIRVIHGMASQVYLPHRVRRECLKIGNRIAPEVLTTIT